jgi:esterase/lipase
MPKLLSSLDKPVLVFNIDNDTMVNENNAIEIKRWTVGDTMLINISESDHLLSGRDKTMVVARDIIEWMKRF